MEAKRLFDEKMQQIKNKSEIYEKRISDKLRELKEWANPDTILPRLKENTIKIISDKRTIYIAIGIALSFLIVKALISRRRNRKMLLPSSSGSTKVPFKAFRKLRGGGQSLLYEMAIMAIQTFLLHYARKILLQFLEGKNKPQNLPPPVKDPSNPA
jgi:hypothetical protein